MEIITLWGILDDLYGIIGILIETITDECLKDMFITIIGTIYHEKMRLERRMNEISEEYKKRN